MDLESIFFDKLVLLNSSKDKNLLDEARVIAKKIPHLNGWPDNPNVFWDLEAHSWSLSIPKDIRKFIFTQLNKLAPKGLNLSLGSGSNPYIKNSVLLDLSYDMLYGSKSDKKIQFTVDKFLPFKDNSFDSVSMVFVANYLKDLRSVIIDIKRILNQKGKLFIIQSTKPISNLYQLQEKQFLDKEKLLSFFKDSGFTIKSNTIKHKNTELLLIEAILE